MRRPNTAATLGASLAIAVGTGSVMHGVSEQSTAEWVTPPAAEAPQFYAPPNSGEQGNGAQEQSVKPIIDLGSLATKGLSPAVQSEISSAAAINLRAADKEGELYIIASAVATKFGYISSAHEFSKDGGSKLDPTCHDAAIVRPQTDENGSHNILFSKAKGVKSYPADTLLSPRATDISVISQGKRADNNPAPMHAHNQDLAVGTPITFVNYMPTGGDNDRSPSQKGKYAKPAIFKGYVLSDPKDAKDQIAVLTAVGPSYGAIYDTAVKGGASGGGDYTDDGTLIGVTTAASELGIDGVDITEIEDEYDVDIRSEKSPNAQVTYLQPVNDALVRGIATDKRAFTAHC